LLLKEASLRFFFSFEEALLLKLEKKNRKNQNHFKEKTNKENGYFLAKRGRQKA
jgi:hypothetical protein